jgi:hypothetical protein
MAYMIVIPKFGKKLKTNAIILMLRWVEAILCPRVATEPYIKAPLCMRYFVRDPGTMMLRVCLMQSGSVVAPFLSYRTDFVQIKS